MAEKVCNLISKVAAPAGGPAGSARDARHPRSRGTMGFSLAELLIAIWVLGVGLAMVAALFPAGMKANEHSDAS